MIVIKLHKEEYKQRVNKVQISCDILLLFGQLVILYCKKPFNQSAAQTTFLYPLCFYRLMRNELKDSAEKKSNWIIKNLLDVLVCSIAEYFYSLLYFNSPYGLVKIRHNS